MKSEELKLCGLAAVRARFEREPGSIKRLFFDEATGRKIGPWCKQLAAARKVYRCVEAAELEKISGSRHHGGIVAVVDGPRLRQPKAADLAAWASRGESLLVLDRVGNAHNLGAIVRTAAFFGVRRVVIPDHPEAALPGEAAHRVAEGGFERVEVWQVRELAAFCRDLSSRFLVVGAAVHGTAVSPDRIAAASGQPLALVMGNEEHGLSPAVVRACARLVRIPGTDAVESLNVSVAAAILIYALLVRPERHG